MNDTPARPPVPHQSATVIMVRDGDEGPEVFLMERSSFGQFGGLHVFPGGKVDAADGDPRLLGLARGPSAADASLTLNLAHGGFAHWVAALRECFEEAGLLLACRADGSLVEMRDPDLRARLTKDRARLNAGEKGALEELCEREGLGLATDRLAYVAHWITPMGTPSRYDTRFFVALAPEHQEALHDGHETVESHWIRPEVALARHGEGEMPMISPTIKNLEALCGYSSARALVEAKAAVDPRDIPTILPRIVGRGRSPGEFEERLEVVS